MQHCRSESPPQEKAFRGGYTEAQGLKATPGTRLDSLKQAFERQSGLLPKNDFEDPQPLPVWFRAYLRKTFPSLPQSGKPQYPREARRLLQWLENNQDFSPEQLQAQEESLQTALPVVIQENERRAKYPKEWEVEVPKGSTLDSLRQALDDEFNILPERDLEDSTPLPIWFRVYLRKNFPDLATSGPYQYPRTAGRILQQMLNQPDSLNFSPR